MPWADATDVHPDIRAAVIGGLAATFVVAVSLAPNLPDHPREVRVRNSSAEGGVDETTTTGATTTTVPETTTTTRQLTLEERVTRIEATTTTTTAPTPVPPTAIFSKEEARDGAWTLVFRALNHPEFLSRYPNARIRFTLNSGQELTVVIPQTPGGFSKEVTFVVEAATGPVFQQLMAVDWDGGSLPNGRDTR